VHSQPSREEQLARNRELARATMFLSTASLWKLTVRAQRSVPHQQLNPENRRNSGPLLSTPEPLFD
jgi:hypothetical protein